MRATCKPLLSLRHLSGRRRLQCVGAQALGELGVLGGRHRVFGLGWSSSDDGARVRESPPRLGAAAVAGEHA